MIMTVKEYQESVRYIITIDGKQKEVTMREHLDYLKQQREKQEKEQLK